MGSYSVAQASCKCLQTTVNYLSVMYPEIAGVYSHTRLICNFKYFREHSVVAQVGRNGSFLELRVVSAAEDSRCTLNCWEQVLLCMSTLNFVKYLFERGGGSSFNLDCENSVLAFKCILLGLSSNNVCNTTHPFWCAVFELTRAEQLLLGYAAHSQHPTALLS